MGTELAALGIYQKADKKNKVYYVNRKNHRFPIPKLDENGKKIPKTNAVTGNPIFNGRGEPEYHEESIGFSPWYSRFTALGYWSVFEVKKDTPKIIADALAACAASKKSEIMSEEAFIEMTNPNMLAEIKRSTELEKEVTILREGKSKADEEIARLKQRLSGNK